MKEISFAVLICLIFFDCSKIKNSQNNTSPSLLTSYKVKLNVGGRVYNCSNHTAYNNATSNYQWDDLNIYFSFPALSAHYVDELYHVSLWDTAGAAITQQELLEFALPATKNFTNYYSQFAYIYFLDTAYSGTAVVSATVTNNGHHTCSGSFDLQGMVAPFYSSDSISFSASGTFTNALVY